MLTEETKVDKIEVIGDEVKSIHVRTATIILKDGVEINRTFHRHVISEGQDYSGEDASVQAICSAVWTQ